MENLFKNYYEMIQATEYCINQHMTIPSLILIYSAIDSVSWIASDKPTEPVKVRFEKWVNKWILNNSKLPCNAEELYAARCGVLHTLTPNSDLSQNKGVRQIAYAWGKAKNEDLMESISELSMVDNLVSIHIEDLFWAFRRGFDDYIKYMFKNEDEKEKFLSKAEKHFSSLEMDEMNKFLKLSRKS